MKLLIVVSFLLLEGLAFQARNPSPNKRSVGGSKALRPAFLDVVRKPPNAVSEASRAGELFPGQRDKAGKRQTDTAGACGVTTKATSASDKDHRCPADCPYYAQNRDDDRHCTFTCVTGDQCGSFNPKKPVPDDKLGICRSPMVQFCRDYVLDISVGIDHCANCMSGYRLASDGQCYYKMMFIIYALAAVLLVVVLVLVAWLVDMWLRPVNNEKVLEDALAFRQNQLLHKPAETSTIDDNGTMTTTQGRPTLWPLRTNLCNTDVAGAGMILHFNFQVAVMVWAVLIAAGWALLAFTVDTNLFILGTRKFGTPRDNCVLVAWGYETQQKLMWTKVLFLWCAYLGSFLLALLHSIRQLRIYQTLDADSKTMRDFMAVLGGLPPMPGTRHVEEDLKLSLSRNLGVKIVGVSVGWNYKEQEDEITKAIKDDLNRRENISSPRPSDADGAASVGAIRSQINALEYKMFGPGEEDNKTDMVDLLGKLETGPDAFVVFETEADRNAAIAKLAELTAGGFVLEGNVVTMEEPHCEPHTVNFQNLGNATNWEKALRLLQGFGFILLALFMWVAVFYAPYAWSVASFNYDNGQEPGAIYGLTFSMVVCVGNVIMYAVCEMVADHVGFRFKDDKEAAYMVFYTIACTFNIAVDMVTTYFMAFIIMSELGFRTYDGTRLSQVPIFPEGFETYAIQRSLAENTKLYAFPSTFLIPFLIEPLPSVFIPLLLGKLIVRCHPYIKGQDAEARVGSAAMEMGRYGDILLNMVLGILIFFFPGGYTVGLFLAMAGSHVYIYAFDHWRVLRAIPTCQFASMSIDWWSQVMLAPLCGLIAACLVFKSQNQEGFPNLSAWATVFLCSSAFVGHCVVHMLLLHFVVPKFGVKKGKDEMEDVTYQEVAKNGAHNWFSVNPVYCLRSNFIYKHSPPCCFQVDGKEHLLEVNHEIGCYYKQDEDDDHHSHGVKKGTPRSPPLSAKCPPENSPEETPEITK